MAGQPLAVTSSAAPMTTIVDRTVIVWDLFQATDVSQTISM
jgi:hypothetical protein